MNYRVKEKKNFALALLAVMGLSVDVRDVEELELDGYEAPKFKMDESITDFYAFTKDSFQMEDYKFHPFNFEIPMAI